ncbi:MAG: hypothetical protein ACHQD8_05800, partial [Chitinophagales bacterium]
YYGYYIFQTKETHVVTDSGKYVYDPETPQGKGLVVFNDNFQQIDYFYKLGYDELLFKLRKKSKKYYYVSKHYDIEYFPFAGLFESNFGDKHAPHRLDSKASELK